MRKVKNRFPRVKRVVLDFQPSLDEIAPTLPIRQGPKKLSHRVNPGCEDRFISPPKLHE
jgi:hypothetical protein